MAKVASREVNREPDSQVFNAGGMTRMRSADDSNEFKWSSQEHESQRGSFYKTTKNNGPPEVQGVYEDACPIYHSACSMQVGEQATSIWEEWKGMNGFREDQWRFGRIRDVKLDKKCLGGEYSGHVKHIKLTQIQLYPRRKTKVFFAFLFFVFHKACSQM